MRLIGAGLPRTATLSQKVALEMLGLEPCYHMVNVLGALEETARWQQVLDGELSPGEILDGFEATVDWPGSFYIPQLIERYPDAKVLLSVRDGDAWARSMRDTIWKLFHGDDLTRHLSYARASVDPQWHAYISMMMEMWRRGGFFDGEDTTAEALAAAMRRHNEEVQRIVPADRLLVWSPADGWEPICELLDLPVPDVPFPRLNDSAEFDDRIIDGALLSIQAHRASTAGASHEASSTA